MVLLDINGSEKPIIEVLKNPSVKKELNVRKFFPPVAFGALLVGATGQGKTYMLKKLLKDKEFYGPAPDRDKQGKHIDVHIIFSDSNDVEEEYDEFHEGKRVLKYAPSKFLEVLDKIKEQQVKFMASKKTKDKTPHICIVIDDCIHLKIFSYNSQSAMCEWLYTNGRHYRITPVITTQYLKSVSPRIRTNSKIVYIFKTFDLQEVEKYIESFVYLDDRSYMRLVIKDVFDEPYSYLLCLPQNRYCERMFANFGDEKKVIPLLGKHKLPGYEDTKTKRKRGREEIASDNEEDEDEEPSSKRQKT